MQHAGLMQTPTARPDRALLAIVSLIALVVALALVVVFTRGTPATLDPATPQGAVQEYTRSVLAGDRAEAAERLSGKLRESCDRVDPFISSGARVSLVSTSRAGDSASVRVAISDTSGGAFGGSAYEFEGVFELAMEESRWVIVSAPPELTICYLRGEDR